MNITMKDPRIENLATLLVNHSCELQRGERILIEAINAPHEIVIALIRAVRAVGATPLVMIKDDRIIRELNSLYVEDDIKLMAEVELYALTRMDAFVSIRGVCNSYEYAEVPGDKLKSILQHYIRPVHLEYKNNHLRWVALRWPTPALAQRARMSTQKFEDYFFDVCNIDYAKMEAAMEPLAAMMRQTDNVRILGPGETDVSFSIKGMSQYKSIGRHNIPDGKLFTAPVRDSIEGHLCYNVPSTYYGTSFENVCLDFQEGRVTNAVCGRQTEKLNEILDQDAGARYVGEFAFGFHPLLTRPMDDILFDEKMTGTVHLAQGNAYSVCDNGNRSAIHWDLILDQREQTGGGSVFFDRTLVRRDGIFVLPELAGLNPENLK